MKSLLPCPTCQSRDVRSHFVPAEPGCFEAHWDVVCHGCARGCGAEAEAAAVSSWNDGTTDTQLLALHRAMEPDDPMLDLVLGEIERRGLYL